MKADRTNLLLGKLCANIGEGTNLSSGGTYTCTTNVIRVAVYENARIKNQFNDDTIGIFIPGGTVEYFTVNVGDIITVLEGEINISSTN